MRLAVFDLDYTIWKPEMYQIYGPPKLVPLSKVKLSPAAQKLARTVQEGMVLADREGYPMQVFEGASYALSDINKLRNEGYDIRAAVASRTDEAHWAQICLDHLVIEDGTVLKDMFPPHLVEIAFSSKTHHLQRLHSKTGIPFEEMCFFDNERWNIDQVSRALPVKCIYTPDGMTRAAWEKAKAEFGM